MGEQDLVILAVKAQVLPVVAAGVRGMLGPDWSSRFRTGSVVLREARREFAGHRLQSLDHGSSHNIGVDHIVGTVTFPAGEIAGPGVVRHTEGNRFPIGELDGSRTERAQRS